MKEILEQNNLKPLKVGEIVKGKIINKERGAIFLDLGPVGTGIIYGKEFYETKDILKNLEIGNEIYAKVVELENEEGYIELSIKQAGQEIAWQELSEIKEKGEIISVKIKGANKGGLLTEISGIAGFLPVSQLSAEHYPKLKDNQETQIFKELQKFIGWELEVQVIGLDPKNQKLILSEKSKEAGRVKEILKNYKEGDVVSGEISGLVDFGAFFRFPVRQSSEADSPMTSEGKENIEGLIHISELDWQLIENPLEIVKVGQKVKAKIIEISDNKVFFSLKALKKNPWLNIEEKYKKGDEVSGKVTKLNPFGAFVRITPKIQALCHISEFGTQLKMEEKLKINKKYQFQVLEIKPLEHRMSLKLI